MNLRRVAVVLCMVSSGGCGGATTDSGGGGSIPDIDSAVPDREPADELIPGSVATAADTPQVTVADEITAEQVSSGPPPEIRPCYPPDDISPTYSIEGSLGIVNSWCAGRFGLASGSAEGGAGFHAVVGLDGPDLLGVWRDPGDTFTLEVLVDVGIPADVATVLFAAATGSTPPDAPASSRGPNQISPADLPSLSIVCEPAGSVDGPLADFVAMQMRHPSWLAVDPAQISGAPVLTEREVARLVPSDVLGSDRARALIEELVTYAQGSAGSTASSWMGHSFNELGEFEVSGCAYAAAWSASSPGTANGAFERIYLALKAGQSYLASGDIPLAREWLTVAVAQPAPPADYNDYRSDAQQLLDEIAGS